MLKYRMGGERVFPWRRAGHVGEKFSVRIAAHLSSSLVCPWRLYQVTRQPLYEHSSDPHVECLPGALDHFLSVKSSICFSDSLGADLAYPASCSRFPGPIQKERRWESGRVESNKGLHAPQGMDQQYLHLRVQPREKRGP